MAESMKDTVQSTFSDVKNKVSGVTQDVGEKLQSSRPLMYAGMGVLAVAVGFGLWALIRKFGEDESETDYYASDNYRRSGAI